MESGRIAETDRYDEPMARNGLFAELAKRQMGLSPCACRGVGRARRVLSCSEALPYGTKFPGQLICTPLFPNT